MTTLEDINYLFYRLYLRNAYHGMSPYVMGLTALSNWRHKVPLTFGIQQVGTVFMRTIRVYGLRACGIKRQTGINCVYGCLYGCRESLSLVC